MSRSSDLIARIFFIVVGDLSGCRRLVTAGYFKPQLLQSTSTACCNFLGFLLQVVWVKENYAWVRWLCVCCSSQQDVRMTPLRKIPRHQFFPGIVLNCQLCQPKNHVIVDSTFYLINFTKFLGFQLSNLHLKIPIMKKIFRQGEGLLKILFSIEEDSRWRHVLYSYSIAAA